MVLMVITVVKTHSVIGISLVPDDHTLIMLIMVLMIVVI